MANITAVLLSCLQALPLHESTHNVPIGLGPPWMNTAKDLLLTLLPSASTIVRRAAAEGLALLATLGVTEDAHFLQSTLLHSLDEVMQGNKPDGKARPIALEPVSAARAGSLLTLACIQRTAHNVSKRKSERARGRVMRSKTGDAVDKSNENLPVLQMMTRILPSAACHGFKDFFVVKAYALHSFAVLLIYSARLDAPSLGDEDKQLLRKAIELVEDNFSASWTAASADIDRGQEAEKMTTEVAFLAVLLRFMTFLLPYLGSLNSEDPDIARRFSVMAAVILESHQSHPVVCLEAMAFFEVLASHQEKLPPLSRRVIYTENPVLSCVPSILSLLGAARPTMFARGLWHSYNSMYSGKTLRAVVHVVSVLSRSHISIAQWSDMKVVALLLASLEGVCGSRHFSGGNLFRSAAASRDIERFFAEEAALEGEVFHAVPTILALESTHHHNEGSGYLRWVLLARHLLSSSASSPSGSSTDEAAGYTRSQVVAAALTQGASDVSSVYIAASPVRWQVKSLAAQLGAMSLCELLKSELRDGREVKGSPQFDLDAAKKATADDCRRASETHGRLPSSRAIFHLEDLLSSASVSSVATIDQAELRTLQESSMKFLVRLVECFGPIPDPEDPAASILDQFSTQIFSSIKHALSASEDSGSTSSSSLFVAGCEVLHKVVETQMTNDPMVLKRLFRPTVPDADSVPPFRYGDGFPAETSTHLKTRSALVVRVGKIWTSGRFLLAHATNEQTECFESVASDLISDDFGLAIHSAACAIDGCRLLLSSNLSLVGRTLPSSMQDRPELDCGFQYQNEADIDDAVKELLVRTWSSCGSRAVKPLLDALSSADPDNQDRREMCSTWIEKLVSIFIAGIYDGMDKSDASNITIDWARGIDSSLAVTDCLDGMSVVARNGSVDLFSEEVGSNIEALVVFLLDCVWLPALGIEKGSELSTEKFARIPLCDEVLSAVCGFIRSLAESESDIFHQNSTLLVPLLKPLNLLQNGDVKFGDPSVCKVVSACLAGVGGLIRRGIASGALVKAMLHLALKDILTSAVEAPEAVREAGKALMKECLTHESVTLKEQQRITNQLAAAGNWEGWTAVSTINQGALIVKSLEVVQETLIDFEKPEAQVTALATLRMMIQKESSPSPLVGQILFKIGADIIVVLYRYGTWKIPDVATSYRTAACADSMKIILSAYQQISADDSDEQQVASFLSVVFGTLLAVVRFNGLPNHASPEVHGDPALGRMCTQAIVHVARTTPAPFKSCVATLTDHDRPLLEFAVRAEMSGYAVAAQQAEPSKKKLNLKAFKT